MVFRDSFAARRLFLDRDLVLRVSESFPIWQRARSSVITLAGSTFRDARLEHLAPQLAAGAAAADYDGMRRRMFLRAGPQTRRLARRGSQGTTDQARTGDPRRPALASKR